MIVQFCRDDTGILHFGLICHADVLRHSWFFREIDTDISIVVNDPGLRRSTSLSNAKPTTFAGHALHFVSSILGQPLPAKEAENFSDGRRADLVSGQSFC